MKPLTTIHVLLFWCLTLHLFSQGYFIREYSAPGFARQANHVNCYDGGFLILNNYEQISTNYEWIALIKTDSAGTIQWTKTFGPMYPNVEDVVQTTDSCYVMCFVEFSYPGYKIVKLDQQGNIVYSNLVNGTSTYQVICAPQLKARNGGGYYIAGDLHNSATNRSRWQLMEFDQAGNLLWTRCYHESFSNGDPHADFDTCSNGDLVLLGSHRDSIVGGPYVARIAPGGNVVWAYWWESPAFNFKTQATAIVAHPNGRLSIITPTINTVTARYETIVLQTDGNGSELWTINFHALVNLYVSEARSVENSSTAVFFGRRKKGGPGVFFKFDSSGYLLAGQKYADHLFGMTTTGNGYMFSGVNQVNGRVSQFTTDLNGAGCVDTALVINKTGVSLVKYAGIEDTIIPMVIGNTTVPVVNAGIYLFSICQGVNINEQSTPETNLFPVPSTDIISVVASHNIQQYRVFDMRGKLMLSNQINSQTFTVDVSALASGSYLIELITENDLFTYRKFEVVH